MEQQERMSIEVCEPGFRCPGCPMIGQPDDILKALNIAVANITAENRYSPGIGARVAVAALYEIGMKSGHLGNTSRIMTKTVERIMQDRCSSYDIDGTRVAREDTNGPTI